jgi:dihydroorotase
VLDVAVLDGRIERIDSQITAPAKAQIDAAGKRLIPGGIDLHVHLRSPGHPEKEDWASGTRAAAAGGITTVCDMPNTDPPTVDWDAVVQKRGLAQENARVHFGLYMGATKTNLDHILRLEDKGQGPLAIKAYLGASTGSLLLDDYKILEQWFINVQALIAVHAEDEAILNKAHAELESVAGIHAHGLRRPREAAVMAVETATRLAIGHGHRLHICHLSTEEELALLEGDSQHLVTCEVTPHHLYLSENDLPELGNRGKMNPPLRQSTDCQALWHALADRRICAIGTDHAPHTLEEKGRDTRQAPSGVPGLDTSLRLLIQAVQDQKLDWDTLVYAFSTGPAQAFGLHDRGRIEQGCNADLVLLADAPPKALRAAELHTRCGWSPFEGWLLPPAPQMVWLGGQLVARDGQIVDDSVRGTELKTRA